MKPRSTLKAAFKKGNIPTESDFVDLIDSMLIQDEDNLSKPPNEPLTIKATGPNEALLTFSRVENTETKPTWKINQKAGDTFGLNIADAAGTSRLFIDSATGNIGIGTQTLGSKLDVNGVVRAVSTFNVAKDPDSGLSNGGALVIKSNAPQIDFIDTNHNDWAIHVNSNKMYFIRQPWNYTDLVLDEAGNVGIGTDAPKSTLSVTGGLAVGATYANTNAAPANGLLVEGNVGIGTPQPGAFKLKVEGGDTSLGGVLTIGRTGTIAPHMINLFQGTASPDSGFLTFGDGTGWKFHVGKSSDKGVTKFLTIQDNGNVGIGTPTPSATLEVNGDIKARSFRGSGANLSEAQGTVNSANAGTLVLDHENSGGASSIVFRSKVNRGSDYGFIQYQDAATVGGAGENALLTIGISNDPDDHIALMPSGNVGIGTPTPSVKLDVNGVVRATSTNNAAKDPDSGLSGGGALVIKSNAPQIDFIDTDHNDWAIHVNSNKMYFIRQPWNYIDLVLDGAGNVGIGTDSPGAKLQVTGPVMQQLEMIRCNNRGDWGAQDHPIMQYFKTKLTGKPIGTYIKAIQDHPSWRGHYWQGWVDADGKIRVIHNNINTGNVVS